MARRIVILGGPGAGKGTQARRLAKKYGIAHVSTGDIFRAHVEEQTEIGRRIAGYMASGTLLPDALACEIVAARLAAPDCEAGYVLDGFPRSIPQAEELDRLLAVRDEGLDIAINLAVSDDEIVERLSARRVCPQCGKIYNLKFKPPLKAGVCDACGSELVHRDDDMEDTIRKRLRVYHETTEPILRLYRGKRVLRSVEGANLSPDAVTEKIEEILAEAGVV